LLLPMNRRQLVSASSPPPLLKRVSKLLCNCSAFAMGAPLPSDFLVVHIFRRGASPHRLSGKSLRRPRQSFCPAGRPPTVRRPLESGAWKHGPAPILARVWPSSHPSKLRQQHLTGTPNRRTSLVTFDPPPVNRPCLEHGRPLHDEQRVVAPKSRQALFGCLKTGVAGDEMRKRGMERRTVTNCVERPSIPASDSAPPWPTCFLVTAYDVVLPSEHALLVEAWRRSAPREYKIKTLGQPVSPAGEFAEVGQSASATAAALFDPNQKRRELSAQCPPSSSLLG